MATQFFVHIADDGTLAVRAGNQARSFLATASRVREANARLRRSKYELVITRSHGRVPAPQVVP
jgi:hypothetical protein